MDFKRKQAITYIQSKKENWRERDRDEERHRQTDRDRKKEREAERKWIFCSVRRTSAFSLRIDKEIPGEDNYMKPFIVDFHKYLNAIDR